MHFYSQKNIQKLEKYLQVKKIPSQDEMQLWEKVSHYNTYFKYVPGVLGIAVCNSLAMNSAHKGSDIDLFIVTKNNRLWTVRIYMTLLIMILGQRKTAQHHAGKFCLSFFVTENGLDFEDIAITNDIYLSYWIDTLKPIINRRSIFEVFQVVNNQRTPRSILSREERGNRIISRKAIPPPSRRGLGRYVVGDYFEKLLKSIFLPRTKKRFHKLGKPFGVVISDTMLKFHDKDKRKNIRDIIISS